MGEFKDKVKGTANEIAGKVKEEIGKATGDRELEAKGAAQNVKGHAQKAVGDVKGKLGDNI
ncbi:CsbD family protein [Sphingomonas sp. TX0543]|uniref:CsbD family protein n=1 Tax=unclassified Sphingomonas TaxID=196159 RepID=UPI0010F65F62|nr:CsbD family protein [Sphingomonas sp. 3P27F8]